MRLISPATLFSCLLLCGCHAAYDTAERHAVHGGETALLVVGTRDPCPVALAKEDAHVLSRALDAKDDAAVKELLSAGRVIEVPSSTRVRVTRESFNERRVEFLDGPHAKKVAWVPYEWLKPDR